ncbi:MAG: BspA family leucine-rich repeat surface protein, partial [Lachnospiraceae bacterium]|nr:BspA family leucine-rich repeat surface protein [Lachnospiraceae bacterium]
MKKKNHSEKSIMTGRRNRIGIRLLAGALALIVTVSTLPDMDIYLTDDGEIGLEVSDGPLEVMAATPADVWHETELSDWETTPTGSEIILDKYIGSATKIEIPASLNGKPVILRGFGDEDAAKNLEGIVINNKLGTVAAASVDGKEIFDGIRNSTKLKYMDLSGLDISQLQSVYSMFMDLPNLEYLNISGFNPENVNSAQVSLSKMFQNDSSLRQLDLTSFDTQKVNTTTSMFNGCSSLAAIYVDEAKFDLSNVNNGNASNMFSGCTSLKGMRGTTVSDAGKTYARVDKVSQEGYFSEAIGPDDVQYYETTNGVFDMVDLKEVTWDNYVNIAIPHTMNVSGTDYEVVLNGSLCDTTNSPQTENLMILDGVKTDLLGANIFAHLPQSMRDLDVSRLNTSAATDMTGMFSSNQCIDHIHFGKKFNTSNVTSMEAMFTCYGSTPSDIFITDLDLSFFDTSKVVTMKEMFAYEYKLTNLELGSFDTSNVTDMESMFQDCDSLVTLDLSSFDTGKVEYMDYMFASSSGNRQLTTIYATDAFKTDLYDESSTYDNAKMFYHCYQLVGGKGSTYSDSNTGKDYAHIDGGHGFMGYFTAKNPRTGRTSYPGWHVTDLSEWGYTASGNDIELTEYRGTDLWIVIPATFTVGGVVKHTILDSLGQVPALEGLIVEDGVKAPDDCSNLFRGKYNMIYMDLSGFDTSETTDMEGMFADMSELEYLNLSGFDTSNVDYMKQMFYKDSSLTQLNLTSFDTH